jgi:hypothetical protein
MNTRRPLIVVTVFVAILSCAWIESVRAEEEPPIVLLPANLTVPNSLRPVLEKMIQRSPKFRQQIETLARRPGVRVNVSYGGLRGERRYHALSTVRRHQWGAMVVQTTLYVPSDIVEVMAHEMEHICEQIEGVDLRRLAAAKSEGILTFSGHYETMRAIRVGQQVAREVTGDIEDSRVRLTKTY